MIHLHSRCLDGARYAGTTGGLRRILPPTELSNASWGWWCCALNSTPVPVVTMDILQQEGGGEAQRRLGLILSTLLHATTTTATTSSSTAISVKPTRLAHLSHRRMKLCYPHRHVPLAIKTGPT